MPRVVRAAREGPFRSRRDVGGRVSDEGMNRESGHASRAVRRAPRGASQARSNVGGRVSNKGMNRKSFSQIGPGIGAGIGAEIGPGTGAGTGAGTGNSTGAVPVGRASCRVGWFRW